MNDADWVLWLDVESGQWGDTDTLRFMDEQQAGVFEEWLESHGDEGVRSWDDCYKLEDIIVDAREHALAHIYETNEWDEMTTAVKQLRDATIGILSAIVRDGECALCGQSYHFHSVSCPVHEVNIALDNVGEIL